jgi:PAS domain S-box-containing protein
MVRRAVSRLVQSIHYETQQLDATAADWAERYDACAHVESIPGRFFAGDPEDSAYRTLRPGVVLLLDSAGELVFGKSYDLNDNPSAPPPYALLTIFRSSRELWGLVSAEGRASGVIILPEGPLLFAARTIRDRRRSNLPRGALLIGRYLSAECVEALSKRVGVQAEVVGVDSPALTETRNWLLASQAASAGEVAVRPVNGATVEGYAIIKDAFGRPGLAVKASMPRVLYQEGLNVVFYVLCVALFAGSLFGGAVLFLLQRRILSRITFMNLALRRIAASRGGGERIDVEGADEIAALALELNKTLDVLETSEEALKESRERLQVAWDGSEDGSWDWDVSSGVVIRNERWAEMLGYAPTEISDDLEVWEQLIHPDDRRRALDALMAHVQGLTGKYECIYRLRAKNGSWKWMHDRGKVVRTDQSGKPVRVAGAQTDITTRKEAQEALTHEAQESERLHRVLFDLTKLEKTNKSKALAGLLKADAETLGVERVSYWSLSEDLDALVCEMLFTLSKGAHEAPGTVLDARSFPVYLNALVNKGRLAADKALTDPLTREFTDSYLRPLGIVSMLDVPVWLGGKICGVLCHEHVGSERKWRPRDQEFAHSIAEMVGVTLEAAERAKAEAALRESEEKYRIVFENAGNGIIVEQNGVIRLLNRKACEILGVTCEAVVDKPLSVFFLGDDNSAECAATLNADHTDPPPRTAAMVNASGDILCVEMVSVVVNLGGEAANLIFLSDVTARKRSEEEHLRVERIQALGVLAGGIAHDFNNILTVVLGGISIARSYAQEGGPQVQPLREAENACIRAQGLTQQLLTFAKGGAPVKKVTDLARLITDSCVFALRGSKVKLELSLEDGLAAAEIDADQIGQVISNLVINADQAMADGGVLRVSARNLIVSETDGAPLEPGRYAEIKFQDEGPGVPEELVSKIFDPYFTTKPKGSGLGLATAYSIVKNHNGLITVESPPGLGAVFRVLLPACERTAPPVAHLDQPLLHGRGTVLVMDDEEPIREIAKEALNLLGYETATASDGAEALLLYEAARRNGKPIDVIIVDLTVPGGMGGLELMKKLMEIDPSVKAVVSSGYANDPIMAAYEKYGFHAVMRKPYTLSELSRTLNRVMGGDARSV